MSFRSGRRASFLVLAAMGALLGVAAAAGAATAAVPVGRADKVLVLSFPRLTWDQVADARPPNLTRLLARSAVASTSTRTVGPETSIGEGYVTIGAGNRATVDDLVAGQALGPDAPFEGGRAADAFARRSLTSPDGAVLHLAMPSVKRLNTDLLYGAQPGSLGTALGDAGRGGAVIANADQGPATDPLSLHREAALAAVDTNGRVAGGAVEGLTRPDRRAPFGMRLDPGAVAQAFRSAWSENDVVLVEASDLERADAYSLVATPAAVARARAQALVHSDELVGSVLEEVDLGRHLVVVIGPAAGRDREQLTVAALAGPGVVPGRARSGTTRRESYITLADVAPTVLDALGVETPASMAGAAMSSVRGERPGPSTFRDLARDNRLAMFRDRATGPVSATFIIFQIATYALAVLALARRVEVLRRAVPFMALVILAFPPFTFLATLFPYDRLGVPGAIVAFFAAAAAVAAGVGWLTRRLGAPPLAAPVLLATCTLVLLVVDLGAGGRLQLSSVFGYSPIIAGRFAGFGNLASALVAVTAILVATGQWGLARLARRPWASPGRALAVAAAVLLLTLVAVGHPSGGSDVGGVLSMVPAFAVVVVLLAGVALNWRRVALIAVATAVALTVFAAIDLSRPVEERTHLARLVTRVAGGGSGDLATVIQRKLNANVHILTSSVWTYVIPAAFGVLAFLFWRPQGFVQRLQRRIPGLRAFLAGALVAGSLGFALNDSGVAVPAMMLAVLLPHLIFLLLRTEVGEGARAGGSSAGTRRGART